MYLRESDRCGVRCAVWLVHLILNFISSSLQFPYFSNFYVIISDVNIRALDFSRHLSYHHLHHLSLAFNGNLFAISQPFCRHSHPSIPSETLHPGALARSFNSIHSIYVSFILRLPTSSASFFKWLFITYTSDKTLENDYSRSRVDEAQPSDIVSGNRVYHCYIQLKLFINWEKSSESASIREQSKSIN